MSCGGVKKIVIKKHPGGGNCFYESLIISLQAHPCGDFVSIKGIPDSSQDWRSVVVEDPQFIESYTTFYNLFKPLSTEELKSMLPIDDVIVTSNGGTVNIKPRIGFPYPWLYDVFMNKNGVKKGKRAIPSLNDFLELAKSKNLNNGSGPDKPAEYVGEIEHAVCTNILKSIGINLQNITKSIVPESTADFGTVENPNVYVFYNMRDHYDSVVPAPINGAMRSRRRQNRKKRKTYRK